VLFHRWIAASAEATSAFNGQADNRLLPYLLAWVAQALATRPHDLFDAPMFFPARGMLTGSEHYLSLQLLFAPAYAWSRNPLLAANFVAMASFVIAAFAMERLLAAAGFAWWSAWLAGLVFGLGPLRYPASIQVIQNLKLFLPLTALAILLLRRRPTARRGASLVAALLAGLFASYYAALNVGLTAVLWTSLEAARPGPRRARFVALVAVALAISVALLAAFSRPYFERRRSFDALAAEAARVHATDVGEPAGVAAGDARNADGWFPFGPFARRFGAMTGAVAPALAVFGLLALAARDPGVRRIAAAGVAFAVAGLALALRFHSRALPSPLSELLGFYRFPWRFLVLFGFGIALLAGAGAEAAGRRFGARRATAASLAAAAILLVADGGKMMWVPLDRVTAIARDAGAYRAVGAIARANGEGPLAEVPRIGTARTDWQYDALLGSMLHGQPLVTGYTGYAPPHSGLVDSWLAELPSPVALADLADATQLRWLLVRPESDWADPVARRRLLAELDRNPEVGPPFEIGSWTLRRIDRAPRHPEWFAALAALPRPDATLLGTPRRALDAREAAGRVAVVRPPGELRARAGDAIALEVSVANDGTETWPVLAQRATGTRHIVSLVVRWRPAATDGAVDDTSDGVATLARLRRDVPPGETAVQKLWVVAPAAPGRYRVEIALAQGDSPRAFSTSHPADVDATVTDGTSP